MRTRKLKFGMLVLGVIGAMSLSACTEDVNDKVNEQENVIQTVSNDSVKNEETTEGTLQAEENENTQESEVTEEIVGIAEISQEKKQIEIFCADKNGETIISEVVEMDQVTATKILGELSKRNIVSADTKVLGLTKQTQGGTVRLKLNMSKEFGEYVAMMGTAGEYIVVGSLVNTFLKAYDAEDVLILVEGEPFETGHQMYDNYLQLYPVEN